MPFIKPTTAADVGEIHVMFSTNTGSDPVAGTVHYQVLDINGVVTFSKSLDIIPLISAGQLAAITTFMAALRTKAKAEAV